MFPLPENIKKEQVPKKGKHSNVYYAVVKSIEFHRITKPIRFNYTMKMEFPKRNFFYPNESVPTKGF